MSQNNITQAGKIQLASALLGERDREGEAVWDEEGSCELRISAACRSMRSVNLWVNRKWEITVVVWETGNDDVIKKDDIRCGLCLTGSHLKILRLLLVLLQLTRIHLSSWCEWVVWESSKRLATFCPYIGVLFHCTNNEENMKHVHSAKRMKMNLFWGFPLSSLPLAIYLPFLPLSLSCVPVGVCVGLWATVRVSHRWVLPGKVQTGHARTGSETLVFLGRHGRVSSTHARTCTHSQ